MVKGDPARRVSKIQSQDESICQFESSLQQPHEPSSQVSAIDGLLSYCKDQQVYISPSIAAQAYPGRGLGIYTLKPIQKGEKLIHVPTKALLTTQSIPESFMSKLTKANFSVHCALAAYLAFGSDKSLSKYQRWTATWPKLEEFTESMPVFWKEDLRAKPPSSTSSEVQVSAVKETQHEPQRAKKRRKTLSNVNTTASDEPKSQSTVSRIRLFPNVDNNWLTLPPSPSPSSPTHLLDQSAKIRACITTIAAHLPQTNILTSNAQYLRFLHAWSLVNTRCFYYLRPGQPHPSDSNEAMALCPFQDLFNHSSATRGCETSYDSRGFFVHADRNYDADAELYLRYGKHSNDMLWMEYGFFMDENRDDEVKIDPVVLGRLSGEERTALTDKGYEGGYLLRWEGVCYRTVVASYIGVLSVEKWKRMVSGGFDPETSDVYAAERLEAKRRIVQWILTVRRETEANLDVLLNIDDEERLVREFVADASLTESQGGSMQAKVELATKRRDMCVRRWMQVFDMCMAAVGEIEGEFAGAFIVAGEEGRSERDLGVSAEQFVHGLRRGNKEDGE